MILSCSTMKYRENIVHYWQQEKTVSRWYFYWAFGGELLGKLCYGNQRWKLFLDCKSFKFMFTNAFLLIISTVVLFLTSCPVQFSLTLTNYLLLSIHNYVKFNWHNIPLKSGKSKCARRIGSILIWNLITEIVFLHLRLTQMWIFSLQTRTAQTKHQRWHHRQ